jgi:hypothetical protein
MHPGRSRSSRRLANRMCASGAFATMSFRTATHRPLSGRYEAAAAIRNRHLFRVQAARGGTDGLVGAGRSLALQLRFEWSARRLPMLSDLIPSPLADCIRPLLTRSQKLLEDEWQQRQQWREPA